MLIMNILSVHLVMFVFILLHLYSVTIYNLNRTRSLLSVGPLRDFFLLLRQGIFSSGELISDLNVNVHLYISCVLLKILYK